MNDSMTEFKGETYTPQIVEEYGPNRKVTTKILKNDAENIQYLKNNIDNIHSQINKPTPLPTLTPEKITLSSNTGVTEYSPGTLETVTVDGTTYNIPHTTKVYKMTNGKFYLTDFRKNDAPPKMIVLPGIFKNTTLRTKDTIGPGRPILDTIFRKLNLNGYTQHILNFEDNIIELTSDETNILGEARTDSTTPLILAGTHIVLPSEYTSDGEGISMNTGCTLPEGLVEVHGDISSYAYEYMYVYVDSDEDCYLFDPIAYY